MDNEKPENIEQEYRAVHRQFLFTLLAAVGLITGGAIIYHHLLHISWVNAFYFCTVTLGTVGYGDITPDTDAAKIFTIFYIFAGIGVIATTANLLVKNASLGRRFRKTKRGRRQP